jgi:hypothetical protein
MGWGEGWSRLRSSYKALVHWVQFPLGPLMKPITKNIRDYVDTGVWVNLVGWHRRHYYNKMMLEVLSIINRDDTISISGRVIPIDMNALLFDEFDIDPTIG